MVRFVLHVPLYAELRAVKAMNLVVDGNDHVTEQFTCLRHDMFWHKLSPDPYRGVPVHVN